ncbi:MAG: hypothetical protein ACREVV_02650 [Steroidobacteraceae bacterium]
MSSLKHASRVTVAALAFLTFGCSGSKSADPGGTRTTAGSTDSIAAGNAYDPCTKLSVAVVQPFFSAPVTMKRETDLVGTSAGCIFSTPDNTSTIQVVTVTGPPSAAFYNGNRMQDGVPSIQLAGVGDKAMREPKDVWIYALKRDTFCMIHSDKHGRSQMRGLQKFADADVPDAVASRMAAQLGTLCNTIYGSGTREPSFAGLD